MKSILFVSQSQFGYLIDYYQYTLFLKEKYTVHYVCWDYRRPKIDVEGIRVHYISRKGNIVIRNLRFIYQVIVLMKTYKFDRSFIHYFRGCSIITWLRLSNVNLFLDIRTASVAHSKFKRKLYDLTLRIESLFFRHVSVVSEGVKKRLQLKENSIIIPLGANEVNLDFIKKEGIHLIYIGTLSNRNIHQTIEGLALFYSENKNLPMSYTIVGTGDNASLSKIENAIVENELSHIVKLIGYVPHDELTQYIKTANVGVAYVPITEYYNFQPATKTFEYLLAGLPVIATATCENKKIINPQNGVLVEDNPRSFYFGLSKLSLLIKTFNAKQVKKNLSANRWDKIVEGLDQYIFS